MSKDKVVYVLNSSEEGTYYFSSFANALTVKDYMEDNLSLVLILGFKSFGSILVNNTYASTDSNRITIKISKEILNRY